MPRNNSKRTNSPTPEMPPVIADPASANSILNFVVPTEHVNLPSQGKFYPSDHPLHDCDTLEIKYISARELDILTSKNLLQKGIAVDRMLQSLIMDDNIKVEELLIGDKNALIIAARVGSFGADYNVALSCTSCGAEFSHEFNLSPSEVMEIDDEENEDISEDGTFFVNLPQTEVRVECRFLTAKDEKILEERAAKKARLKLPDTSLTDQYKFFIVSLNGVTDRSVVDEFVDVMPAKDLHHLSRKYEKVRPDLDLIETCICSECDAEIQVVVPFTATFFWPE